MMKTTKAATERKTMWGVKMANGNWYTTHPVFATNGTPNPNLAGVFSEQEARTFAAQISGTAETIPYTTVVR